MDIGSSALGTTPIFVMNSFIHIASCEASEAAMYSDSIEDLATTLCFALLCTPPANCCTIQSKYVSRLRFRIIRIGVPTGIGVTINNELFITSIRKNHILSSSQVLKDVFDHCPMIHPWITLISASQTNSICNVGSST